MPITLTLLGTVIFTPPLTYRFGTSESLNHVAESSPVESYDRSLSSILSIRAFAITATSPMPSGT